MNKKKQDIRKNIESDEARKGAKCSQTMDDNKNEARNSEQKAQKRWTKNGRHQKLEQNAKNMSIKNINNRGNLAKIRENKNHLRFPKPLFTAASLHGK